MDGLFSDIAKINSDITIGGTIDNWCNDLENKFFTNAKSGGNCKQILYEIEDYIKKFDSTSKNPKENGSFIQELAVKNHPKVLENAKVRIEQKVADWLDDEYRRLPLVIDLVKELYEYIKDLARESFELAEDWRIGDDSPDYTWGKVSKFYQMILVEEASTGPGYRGLAASVKATVFWTRSHLKARAQVAVYTELAELINDLAEWLGTRSVTKTLKSDKTKITQSGFQLTLQNLMDDFQQIGSWAEDQFNSFKTAKEHHIFVNVYDEKDFDEFYRFKVPSGGSVPFETNSESLETSIRQKLEINHLFELRELIQQRDLGSVLHVFKQWAFDQFAGNKLVEPKDVLSAFNSINAGNIVGKTRDFIHSGEPRLPFSNVMNEKPEMAENYKSETTLGMNNELLELKSDWKDFKLNSFNAISAARWNKGGTINQKDAQQSNLYIYNEIGGLPLMAIEDINKWRKSYIKVIKKDSLRHITRFDDKFDDIIRFSQEEVQIRVSALESLLMGLIFRQISIKHDIDGIPKYYYNDIMVLRPVAIPLGKRNIALETITNDLRIKQLLDKSISNLFNKMNQDKDLMLKFMTLLSTLIDSNSGNAPYPLRYIETGAGTRESSSSEYLLINRIFKKIEGKLLDSGITMSGLRISDNELSSQINSFTDEIVMGQDIDMGIMRVFNEATLGKYLVQEN